MKQPPGEFSSPRLAPMITIALRDDGAAVQVQRHALGLAA